MADTPASKSLQKGLSTFFPGGETFKMGDQLLGDDWDIVVESVYMLNYFSSATDLLQGTKYPTVNLLLPIVGKLAHMSNGSTWLKHNRKRVEIEHEAVKEAVETLHDGLSNRYFYELMDCKLEDYCVATILDPRYKSFNFKCANSWMKGGANHVDPVGLSHTRLRLPLRRDASRDEKEVREQQRG
ncbi:hypothetical protein CYMTET_4810 [Cymbomonas tetramitiformis]|uniref:Uncharacterized protein n=1 Tax=Cymbomonas tetramitiformis TaxID=36881 RepID=A0AAE0H0N4_9CHLO|nr:hypothetical protein CYMTET_4810 [Cymbomonas tetramitiformis]